MADILIRGMEMPKTCVQCDLKIYDPEKRWNENGIEQIGAWVCKRTGEIIWNTQRGENCPLVPLPEGHGRLIDADALKKRTPMVIDYSACGFGTDGSIRPVRGYGDWQIDQAPTIVPAEGGTDNGN